MFPPPGPFHFSSTLVLRSVEMASCTDIILHYCGWLESVCQNDVRVHCGNIQMIYHGCFVAIRVITEGYESIFDGITDFVEIHHFCNIYLLLFHKRMRNRSFYVVDKLLNSFRDLWKIGD